MTQSKVKDFVKTGWFGSCIFAAATVVAGTLGIAPAHAQSSQTFDVSFLCQPVLDRVASLANAPDVVSGSTAFDLNCLAQRSLIQIGYLSGNTTVDGFVGQQTSQALERFQTNFGLPAFGIVTPETIDALSEAENELLQITQAPAIADSEPEVVQAAQPVAPVVDRCVAPLVLGQPEGWGRLPSDLPESCHTHGNWNLNEFSLSLDLFRFDGAETDEPSQPGRLLIYVLPEAIGPRVAISMSTLSAQASATESDLMVVRTSVPPFELTNAATCQLLNAGLTASYSQLSGLGSGYALAQVERESARAVFGLNPNLVGDALLVMIDDGLGFGGFQPQERAQIVTLGLPVLELSPSNLQNADCALFGGLAGSLNGAKLFSPFDPTIGTDVIDDIAGALLAALEPVSVEPQNESGPQAPSEPVIETVEVTEPASSNTEEIEQAAPILAVPEPEVETAAANDQPEALEIENVVPQSSIDAAARLEALTNSMAALLEIQQPSANDAIQIVPEPLFGDETGIAEASAPLEPLEQLEQLEPIAPLPPIEPLAPVGAQTTEAVAVAPSNEVFGPQAPAQNVGDNEQSVEAEYEAVGVASNLSQTAEGLNRRRILPDGEVETVVAPTAAQGNGKQRVSLGATAGSALIEPLLETANEDFGLDFNYRSVVLPSGLTVPGRRSEVEITIPWFPLPDILNFEVDQYGAPMVWSISGAYAYPFGQQAYSASNQPGVSQGAAGQSASGYATAVDPLANGGATQYPPASSTTVTTTTYATASGQTVATVLTPTTRTTTTTTSTPGGDFRIISVSPDVTTNESSAVITLPDGTIFVPE